jgi:hypothetical protein
MGGDEWGWAEIGWDIGRVQTGLSQAISGDCPFNLRLKQVTTDPAVSGRMNTDFTEGSKGNEGVSNRQ